MLRWTISLAINRLFFLALILIAIRTFGSSSCQAGGPLGEWLDRLKPFDEIARALR
jgi:hypothetical protein